MIAFRKGAYRIGSEEGSATERPVRQIDLDAFWIDVNLVTNAAFAEFAERSGYVTDAERCGEAWGWRGGSFEAIAGLSWRSYSQEGREDHPVVLVSWTDAKAYADWRRLRLPTEFEWEVAASCGDGRRFPWSDDLPAKGDCNWHRTPTSPPPTTAVGSFAPNSVGLYDMVGNVWQWCENVFDGSEKGLRARRGGAWNVIQDFRLRCANRGALPADAVAPNMGFRCAADFRR